MAIDEINLTIDIKRGVSSIVPHPAALIPNDMVGSDVLRDSLMRLGSWVAENGIDGAGPFPSPTRSLASAASSIAEGSVEIHNR